MLELGFNSAVQTSTGQSPYEMMYGMAPRLPIDVALAGLAPRNPAAIDRARRMREVVAFARCNMHNAHAMQTSNAKRGTASHAVGVAVLLSTDGLQLRGFSNKLTSRFIEPSSSPPW